MITDVSAPCLRCSADSAPHGEHHREHKGMGGRGWKAPEIAHERDVLCRGCHDAHHDQEFNYKVQGDFYVGTKGGDFRSPVTFDNESEDKRFWEVDKLTADWHDADKAAVYCYKVQCQDAYAIYDRIGWMPEWWIQAAEQFSKDKKKPVHWSLVYDRVGSWQTFELLLGGGTVWADVPLLGVKARQAVRSHADPQWALDTAVVEHFAGTPVAGIVKLLKGGEILDCAKSAERCVCGEGEGCGQEHTKKGG